LNLTDHQWRLLEILFNDPSHQSSRGRPALNPRPIIDAILWKIRHDKSWEKIPTGYPSHPTCYRRYRLWRQNGLLEQVFLTLYKDLLNRGRFDPQQALREGAITITHDGSRYRILAAADLSETWQLSTALVFIQLAIKRLKRTLEL
jgi:transposase